jgi:hypothetical protein
MLHRYALNYRPVCAKTCISDKDARDAVLDWGDLKNMHLDQPLCGGGAVQFAKLRFSIRCVAQAAYFRLTLQMALGQSLAFYQICDHGSIALMGCA